MFPMEDSAKKSLYDYIGGRLAKYGDNYSKGSALFTKAAQLLDELDRFFIMDSPNKSFSDIPPPKHKEFKPVLRKL